MRVLVTRPEPEAAATAARLASLGHQPVVAPLTAAEPLPPGDIPADIAALAVTSARTAAMLDEATARRLAGLTVFAVGARTAGAMAARGFAHLHVAEGDVVSLGRLIVAAGLPAGSRLVHLGGEERAGDLAAPLREAGLTLEVRPLYRMVPAPALPEAVAEHLRRGDLDAALHYSPRSARIARDLILAAGLGAEAARLRHLCLSENVAAPLAAAGWPCRTAARPDEPSLLALLAA